MLQLEIITPDRVAYTNTVDMVVLPSAMGTIGILPKHIPLVSQLVEGEIKIKKNDQNIYLSIGGGFVEVTKDKVMVLVTRAVNAKELNETEITKAKQEAVEALKRKPTGKELVNVQALLRQSIIDAQILRRRRKRVN